MFSIGVQEVQALIQLFWVVMGALNCFFGYWLFMFQIRLLGAIIGLIIGFVVGLALAFSPQTSQSAEAVLMITTLLGGAAGFAIAPTLYLAWIFLFGALLGFIVGAFLGAGFDQSAAHMLPIFLAFASGIFALMLQKLLIVISTAFAGAWALSTGIFGYDPLTLPGLLHVWQHNAQMSEIRTLLLVWATLGVAGILFQYWFTGRKKLTIPTTGEGQQ